jgi:hypothetical protein
MLDTLKHLWTSLRRRRTDQFAADLARDFPGRSLDEIIQASPYSVYWEQGFEEGCAVIDDRTGRCVGKEGGLTCIFYSDDAAQRFIIELIRKDLAAKNT